MAAATKDEQIAKLKQAKDILRAKGLTPVDWAAMSYAEILKAAGVKQ